MLRRLNLRLAGAAVAAVAAPAALLSSFSTSEVRADGVVPGAAPYPAPAPLDPQNWKPFKLAAVQQLTPDTKKYTFALDREDQELGMGSASLLLVKADVEGKAEIRPYTPTSPASRRGSFDLIVKAYEAGKVSKALDGLAPGSTVDMKGPIVKFKYEPNQWAAVGMVAGGTGITPMYQLIQEILSNPRDKTEIRLVYASRSPADIILKTELDALAVTHPNFKVTYIVDKGAPGWKGKTGYVTPELLASVLPPPTAAAGGAAHKVLVCGPPGLMKLVSGEKKSPADQGELVGLLADLKYTKDDVFKY